MTIKGTFQDARRCALALAKERQEFFIAFGRRDIPNEYVVHELTFPGDQPEDSFPDVFQAGWVADYR